MAQGRSGNIRIKDRGRLRDLAAFVEDSPQARLERQGYQFYDRTHQPRPAFMARKQGSVGRAGEVWISSEGDPATLEQRLKDFHRLLGRVGHDVEWPVG